MEAAFGAAGRCPRAIGGHFVSDNDLDRLIEIITVDCYGDDEQVNAFLTAFADEVELPAQARVLGMDVAVVGFDCPGQRREVVALCRKDGVTQEIGAADLEFPPDSPAAWTQAAYRRWLGLLPRPALIPPGWEPGCSV
jgi:hypothetical protein